jgi:hypothetical protein
MKSQFNAGIRHEHHNFVQLLSKFIRYMKSSSYPEICQERQECYPVRWFDRQLLFKFEHFEYGDSGASVVDKDGGALGILHAKRTTNYCTYGIASPYFAVLEALNVDACLSSEPVNPTVVESSSTNTISSSNCHIF